MAVFKQAINVTQTTAWSFKLNDISIILCGRCYMGLLPDT